MQVLRRPMVPRPVGFGRNATVGSVWFMGYDRTDGTRQDKKNNGLQYMVLLGKRKKKHKSYSFSIWLQDMTDSKAE
jgi:hypothetical protein